MLPRPLPVLLVLALACTAPPAAACGQRPGAHCSVTELIGDWHSADGQRLRFVDSRDRGFSVNAHVVAEDGRVGVVLYRQLKPGSGCSYTGWRSTSGGDLQPVRLDLNAAAGRLFDENDRAAPRVYRRLAKPAEPRH